MRTIPVYAFAGALMLLTAWASDRLRHRLGFILAGAGLTLAGYGMLLAQAGHSRGYKFAAVFLVLGGAYVGIPMALGWLQNNLSGHWKRSLGSVVQVTVGNLAGIVGSVIFLERERPGFAPHQRGHGRADAARERQEGGRRARRPAPAAGRGAGQPGRLAP